MKNPHSVLRNIEGYRLHSHLKHTILGNSTVLVYWLKNFRMNCC